MEEGQWITATGSALIAASASAVFFYLLPALFPTYYAEQHWTVGKCILNLLGLFLLIAVGVCFWIARMTGHEASWQLFFYSLTWVLILATFPTTLFVLWNYNSQLKHNLQEALALNATLLHKAHPKENNTPASGRMLHFQSTTKDSLQVATTNFLYAEAEGNYVRVVYQTDTDKKPVQHLLRITLKQAEETVSICPSVIRCHRAFLVNLDRIIRIDGNSQGYRLRLAGCEAQIPVSRSYAKALKEHLEA